MRDLPSGAVTLLFTDIEGSTQLLQALGERGYAEALTEHRRLLRKAFADHGGVEVDTQGDAFFVAFPTAPDAVAAARRATDDLSSGPIRVRMGLHTGTPLVTADGYVGTDVHRAARIAAAGHGGQVLVSAATASLVNEEGLRDLGEHRFKDLAGPERVYQLGTEPFPPLKSLYRANLPVQVTPFLGRERELSEVVELLRREDTRLLSLIGPGGSGKTRLALQGAAEASDEFPDGIWWVPLAPLRDPSLVWASVASTLGLKVPPGVPLSEALVSDLGGKRALILLDNCEHLMPEAADAVGALRDSGGPTICVTSRERLRIRGERTWPVPPLSEGDGVALFTSRAQAIDPAFAMTTAARELCDGLDGLPLAIELAAARTALFTPEQILERLGQRLDLLTGERDIDPRQRTLRATIGWSYDLLIEQERDLFARLSVFAGGFSYDAAEHVCGANPDTLQSLLDKSLVHRRDADAGSRFWMLETIREFAAELLTASGNLDQVREAHAAWFSTHVARLAWGVREEEPGAGAALAADLPNARAGLSFAFSRKDVRMTGDFLFGLWFRWFTEGLGPEAATAADGWLNLDRTELTAIDRLPGLFAAGEIVRFTGDLSRAAELKREELAIAREHDNAIVRGWEIRRVIPATLSDLSQIELALGNVVKAGALADEALSIRRRAGELPGIGHALVAVGIVALVAGDIDRARASFVEATDALAGTSDAWSAALYQAECDLLLGDITSAAGRVRTCVGELRKASVVVVVADAARVAASLAQELGDDENAAVLLEAFVRILHDAGMSLFLDAHWHRTYETMTDDLRAKLGEASLYRARAQGAQLTTDEVLDLALSVVS
jgi:predicted ATPase